MGRGAPDAARPRENQTLTVRRRKKQKTVSLRSRKSKAKPRKAGAPRRQEWCTLPARGPQRRLLRGQATAAPTNAAWLSHIHDHAASPRKGKAPVTSKCTEARSARASMRDPQQDYPAPRQRTRPQKHICRNFGISRCPACAAEAAALGPAHAGSHETRPPRVGKRHAKKKRKRRRKAEPPFRAWKPGPGVWIPCRRTARRRLRNSQRKTSLKYYYKNRARLLERNRELRFRWKNRGSKPAREDGLCIIDARHESNQRITWVDVHGRLHGDDLRSAEEVIRDWHRSQLASE